MEKTYFIDVRIEFSNVISASSEEEAITILKETLLQDYGMELIDKEIIDVDCDD